MPRTLRRLELSATDVAPFELVPGLERLALSYASGPTAFALPASLREFVLTLGGRGASPLPRIEGAGALVRATVRTVTRITRDQLSTLASVEQLALSTEVFEEGALDDFANLRELRLFARDLPATFARNLRSLRELEVYGRITGAPALAGLAIERIEWQDIHLDALPPGLPLRRVHAAFPLELASLARFLDRNPMLADVELEVAYGTLDTSRTELWVELVRMLERSGVETFKLRYSSSSRLSLRRDASGRLSQLSCGMLDRVAETVAGALSHVTAIEAPTKLPARMKKLISAASP